MFESGQLQTNSVVMSKKPLNVLNK